jgi:hypothetical protein
MLDVHPPHSPTHTWKDFLIHIATIVVGLLIAVGLEQTVEHFHHQHQSHELVAQLQTESESNQVILKINLAAYDARLKWLLGVRKDVNAILATHGKAAPPIRVLTYPPRGFGIAGSGTMLIFSYSYDAAQADGRLGLLPDGVRQLHGKYSARKAQYDIDDAAAREASATTSSYANQFADISSPTTPVLARMSETQLMEYRALLTNQFDKTRELRRWIVLYLGDLNLMGDQAQDKEYVAPISRVLESEAVAKVAYPEDYAKVAAEIDAEDAARDKTATKLLNEPNEIHRR